MGKRRHREAGEEEDEQQPKPGREDKKTRVASYSELSLDSLLEREVELANEVRQRQQELSDARRIKPLLYGNNEARQMKTRRIRAEYAHAEVQREIQRRFKAMEEAGGTPSSRSASSSAQQERQQHRNASAAAAGPCIAGAAFAQPAAARVVHPAMSTVMPSCLAGVAMPTDFPTLSVLPPAGASALSGLPTFLPTLPASLQPPPLTLGGLAAAFPALPPHLEVAAALPGGAAAMPAMWAHLGLDVAGMRAGTVGVPAAFRRMPQLAATPAGMSLALGTPLGALAAPLSGETGVPLAFLHR